MSWRRILLLSIGLVLILGIVTWSLLQHSDIATELVNKQLSELFAVRADVTSTRVELGAGRLELEGFTLADPTQPKRNLVAVDKGYIEVQADPLGAGVQPRLIVLNGLHVECGPAWPQPGSLLNLARKQANATPQDLPVVEIRSGTATIHLCKDERPLAIDQLEVAMTPRNDKPTTVQVRGSLHLREPSAELQLLGEIDTETGGAQLSMTAADVQCTPDIVAYLARLAKVDRQSLEVAGAISSLTLLVRIPRQDAADRTPIVQLSVDCQQLRVRHPDLPSLVSDAGLKVFFDSSQHGMVQAALQQKNRSGTIAVDATIKNLRPHGDDDAGHATALDIAVRATGRNVVIDTDVLAALRTFPIGRQLVDALQPTTGHGDIDLFLHNPHQRGGKAELELVMRDVAMTFVGFGEPERRIGFPFPLVEAKGRVRLRNDVLLLEDLSAKIPASAGGGDVTLVGRIDIDKPAREDTNLNIAGTGVAFGADLRRALGTLLSDDGELYDMLSPSGRASVQVQVQPLSQLPGGFRVEVLPQGASMRWQGFPYELTDLGGSIVVNSSSAQFDLTGRHDSGALTMAGRIPIPLHAPHAAEDGFEAVIDVERLVLDQDLRKAAAVVMPELEDHWQRAEPTGRISGQVKVWRTQPDRPLQHDVRLALEGVDLRLPLAPWRATGLKGQVLVQGEGPRARIDFDALRGELTNDKERPAQLALLGHITADDVVQRDLAFVVRDLELCQQLGMSLDELGALDFATWYSLKPSGQVDLVVRERAGDDIIDGENLQVVVQLMDVRSEAPMLPGPAEHMTGELRIGNGELTFDDVRGEIKDTLVRAWDGRVRHLGDDDGRTEISFAMRTRSFPVDDGLANLFSGPLRTAVRDRQLRGRADVDELRLLFRIPTPASEQPFTTTIRGQIGLDGLTMLLGTGDDGIRVHELRGVADLAESTVTESGGALRGTLRSGSLSLFGHPFERVEATFTADAERLVMQQLKASVHGGEMRHAQADAPALTYLLPAEATPEGRLAADLAFERVDVFSLLEQGGWNNAPYSGEASGRVTLRRLDGNDVVGAIAEGTMQIDDADLGEVPLFKAINAQLPPSERPRFDSLSARFKLGNEKLDFEDLEVGSDLLNVRGDGALALDGYLDLVMSVENPGGVWRDPIVMPLIGTFMGSLVRVHVFGHLRDLRTDGRLVIDSSPSRTPIMPLPPTRKAPAAPGY